MQSSHQRWIALGLVVLVGLAWFAARSFIGSGPREVRVRRPNQIAADGSTRPRTPSATNLVAPEVVVSRYGASGGTLYSTVLWPLEIELELVEARHRPKVDGVAHAGSGADAVLRGRITGDRGDPIGGVRVEFVEGANAGRTLVATVGGEFGATDLYPGLSVVEVRGDGILGSRREVRLRARKESLLNIPYGRPAAAFGQVYDHKGEPLANAKVLFDGLAVYTDGKGEFYVSRVAGGPCLVEVSAEGHATMREVVNVTSGRVMERDRLKFRLLESCSLELICRDRIGGPGPIEVTLLPTTYETRIFPWYSVNPIEVTPGAPTVVEGLPRGPVRIIGFRQGATMQERGANLRPGRKSSVELTLSRAPELTGVVRRAGEPVAGALVRLEAPDRVQATLGFHRKPTYFLETAVMEFLAPALQEVRTDGNGAFRLSSWGDASPVRYLEAWAPDSSSWARRVVERGDTKLELELEPVTFGRAKLSLDIIGRHMGLPVVVRVNGQPYSELVVPADSPLEIESLVEGVWRLTARWQATVVQPEMLLELDGELERGLPTIPEIIDGQTEEQWSRAGKTWPGPPQ